MFTRDEKHCLFAHEGPSAPEIGNNLGICRNGVSPVGTNIAKQAHNTIRAIFGDFPTMVLGEMDKPVVCVTIGLSVILENA